MAQIIKVVKLVDWFDEATANLKCSAEARAYIINVLSTFKSSNGDLSNESIVLEYAHAKQTGKFEEFQTIGDWVLFVETIYPESIQDNKDVVETIGRCSYYACHRLLNRSWRVYEELADELPKLACATSATLKQRGLYS